MKTITALQATDGQIFTQGQQQQANRDDLLAMLQVM